MSTTRLEGDLIITGRISSQTMSIPAATVNDAAVASDAAIGQAKLKHEHREEFAQDATANAAAEIRVVHVAKYAGTVNAVDVGLVTPPDTAVGSSGRTATIDVKKNGTTILSATVTLNSTNTAYSITVGVISSAAFVAGDVFTVAVTIAGSVGTYPKGVFAQVTFYENGA